ncbi:MAG TPA: TRAP transporter substrate-binding protein DctP [Zeimonas sp.]
MRLRCAFLLSTILPALASGVTAPRAQSQPASTSWTVSTVDLSKPSIEAVEFLAARSQATKDAPISIRPAAIAQGKLCSLLKEQAAGLYASPLSVYRACFPDEPLLQAMDFPFLASNWDEARVLLNGAFGAAVADGLKQSGVEVLSFWYGKERVLAADVPITTPSDMKGRKVLTPRTFASASAIDKNGGTPLHLPSGETAQALSKGLAGGADTTLEFFRENLAGVRRTAVISNHSLDPVVLTVASTVWQELPPEQRAYVEAIARQATAAQVERFRAHSAEQKAAIERQGATVSTLSDSDLRSFRTEPLLRASELHAADVFASRPPRTRAAISLQLKGQAKGVYYQVYFATNRKLRDRSFENELGSDLVYGKAEVELEFDELAFRPGELLHDLIRFGAEGKGIVLDWTSMSRSPPPDAVARVPRQMPAKAPMVYVHGFANSLEDALARGAWLGWNAKRPALVFAWPAQGPATRPGYETARESADASAEFLADVLEDLGRRYDTASDVDAVIHSMGGRVMLAALEKLQARQAAGSTVRFRQLVLVAPDVGAAQLQEEWPRLKSFFERKATLYASDHDLALGISKALMNPDEGARAGLAPPVAVLDGIESIFIGPNELSLTGHSYHVANGIIADDLMETLRYGVPAIERRGIIRSTSGGDYFELRRMQAP